MSECKQEIQAQVNLLKKDELAKFEWYDFQAVIDGVNLLYSGSLFCSLHQIFTPFLFARFHT